MLDMKRGYYSRYETGIVNNVAKRRCDISWLQVAYMCTVLFKDNVNSDISVRTMICRM